MTVSLTTPRPLIAGNWKMFGLEASLDEARAVAAAVAQAPPAARVAICPPATLLHRMAEALSGELVVVGGQDCHAAPQGAYTGDISAPMLADAGAQLVILGHSERRGSYDETCEEVSAKVLAALAAGLEPVICLGETLAQREAGQAEPIVTGQARNSLPDELAGQAFAVAYEPVWAIGTGLTPTIADIGAIHAAIRGVLVERFGDHGRAIPILYGGSVKPENAAEILATPEVGGALVGGASLKAKDFLAIIRAA